MKRVQEAWLRHRFDSFPWGRKELIRFAVEDAVDEAKNRACTNVGLGMMLAALANHPVLDTFNHRHPS